LANGWPFSLFRASKFLKQLFRLNGSKGDIPGPGKSILSVYFLERRH
jgi:hypothetical protein